MNKSRLIFTLLAAGICSTLLAAPPEKPSTSPQFVGFTTDTFNGGQGVATYTNACQQAFTDSHMCSSQEYLDSTSYPTATGNAWIKPTFVPVSISVGSGANIVMQDASGMVVNRSTVTSNFSGISCAGWSYANNDLLTFGLHVSGTGQFGGSGCGNTLAVACCQ